MKYLLKFQFFLTLIIFMIGCSLQPVDSDIQPSANESVYKVEDTCLDNIPILYSIPNDGKSYIFYIKYNSEMNQNEIWAINSIDRIRHKIFSGEKLWLWEWSPLNHLWLFTTKSSIYVADADGGNIRVVFCNQKYTYIIPFWLNEKTILFNAYSDILLPPDVFMLNIENGILEKRNDDFIFQSVFPSIQSWLLINYDEEVKIEEISGKVTKLETNLKISLNPFDPNEIQLITSTGDLLFKASQSDNEFGFWKLTLNSNSISRIFENNQEINMEEFLLSPNEELIAFTSVEGDETYLRIFDVASNQIINNLIYPYHFNSTEFIWSPDSKYVVTPYAETTINPPTVDSGIQVMNVITGSVELVLNENVTKIVAWR